MPSDIRGTIYTKTQAEHQHFPEEYFSGSDVSIYFGDTFVDEAMGLEFDLEERVAPIFGYNSYTFDAAARGQRIVQGSFTIAFKEAGYIHRIMDHIGQLTYRAKPRIAYDLAGDKARPEWLGGVQETIEELLDRAGGQKPVKQVLKAAPKWPTMSLGAQVPSVKALQETLRTDTAYSVNSDSLTQNMGLPGIKGISSYHAEVPRLKARLNLYLYDSGAGYLKKRLNPAGNAFDNATAAAVKLFQKNFSKSLSPDGIVGPLTRAALNSPLAVTGVFDAPTKLAVMRYQRNKGLVIDGIFGAKSLAKMEVSVNVPGPETGVAAEIDYARYEADVWSGKSRYDNAAGDTPHFYNNDKQAWLRSEGFDIFVNYGQLPQTRIQNGKVEGYTTHGNTVNAIRGVQLTGVSKVIGPTGEAIAERYRFIAKDLD